MPARELRVCSVSVVVVDICKVPVALEVHYMSCTLFQFACIHHLSHALVEIHVVRHLRNVPVLSAWETFMADT